MKPKSDNLFHFTKSIDYLKSILVNGFYPRHCLEDVEWVTKSQAKFAAYPMVCFCDIPISRVSDHTAFYGQYGLGLTKEWGLAHKLAPVLYATPGSQIPRVAEFLLSLAEDADPVEKKSDAWPIHAYEILSLTKPVTGQILVGGSPVEKEFFQENEWRFVPSETVSVMNRWNFLAVQEQANADMEKYAVKFSPGDVKYVFVKADSEIPDLVDFINTRLGHFPHNAIKLLTTRILSLDTISADL